MASATAPRHTITLDGKTVYLRVAPVGAGEEMLVWLRDLEQTGKVRAGWDPKTKVAVVEANRVIVELKPEEPTMHIIRFQEEKAERQTQVLAAAPVIREDRLLVPLYAVCGALGISTMPPATPMLAAEDHPDPKARGSITGEVQYNHKPLAGIVLRLVRATDGTFVKERRAETNAEGQYRFLGVPIGRYRVYAYVGDNADYFNRETDPLAVRQPVTAPMLVLGRIIRPEVPTPGEAVSAAQHLSLQWSVCPSAAQYEVTLTDTGTKQEVLRATVTETEMFVDKLVLEVGHSYQIRVTAKNKEGEFLGATAGTGGECVGVYGEGIGAAGDRHPLHASPRRHLAGKLSSLLEPRDGSFGRNFL